MNKIAIWVSAARLRTLPLSLAGILVGTALANYEGYSDWLIFILCILTTIGFQVTSNFANDYGDGVKGTDDANRIGPARALQSGRLTATALKKGVIRSAGISLILSVGLLYLAFGSDFPITFMIFIGLGLLSIWAAIRYTMGASAYGYKGFGDLAVFLFFGLLAVLGSKFLFTYKLSIWDSLPAAAIGLLATGVLNLNNLRDRESDKVHGKNTVIVKIGYNNGKKYHLILLLFSFVLFLGYALKQFPDFMNLIFLVAYLPIAIHLKVVMQTNEPAKLDPELKKLALSTFLLSVLFYVTVNYFL